MTAFDVKETLAEKSGGAVAKIPSELPTSSKPLREKTTKAERRALQESQRAAKAASKGLNCKFYFFNTIFICFLSSKPRYYCIYLAIIFDLNIPNCMEFSLTEWCN